jgi:hypothetical protein
MTVEQLENIVAREKRELIRLRIKGKEMIEIEIPKDKVKLTGIRKRIEEDE